jgi:16S rRNA (guanine527-N7)-methyltransferase
MLTADEIAGLLKPYVGSAKDGIAVDSADSVDGAVDWPPVYEQLAIYLRLILKWNARTNLTAIREPEQIVRRHFGESLFAGGHLGICASLLDFGSGAGFPGVPIQMMRPDLQVTLAESQGKKVAFLQEAVRELGLRSGVWAGRVEEMAEGRRFDAVTMRAVDKMGAAVLEGAARARERLLILGTLGFVDYPGLAEEFERMESVRLPGSKDGILLIAER